MIIPGATSIPKSRLHGFMFNLIKKSWMDSTGESKPVSSQTEPPCRVSIGNHNQFCNHFNHVPENFKNHSMQYYYVVQCQEYLTALLQTVAHEKFTFCPSVVALPIGRCPTPIHSISLKVLFHVHDNSSIIYLYYTHSNQFFRALSNHFKRSKLAHFFKITCMG